MPYPKRDRCSAGHTYTLETTGYHKRDGARLCLLCQRGYSKATYQRMKVGRAA